MTWFRENAFEGLQNLGDFLASDIVTSPIRRMIDREAEHAGIDARNPRRFLARFLGSCGMATALGSVLGPPGGVLGGLLGYVVATGSDYEGDQPRTVHESEEEAQYLLELKALQIAAEVTESLVDKETWNEICDEVCDEIDRMSDYSDLTRSLDSAVDLMIEIVTDVIRRVDFEAHSVRPTL